MSAPSPTSLPIVLSYGYVAVYGLGSASGISGIVPTNASWVFGYISKLSPYGISSEMAGANINDSVVFKESDAQLAIKYNEWPYTIIEQSKLGGLTEQEVLPP